MVWPLALAQLVSWGCVYYSFSLFVTPIEQELGWSKAQQNFALTLALMMLAVLVYPLAKWLDSRGGRAPMTLAAIVAGGLLFILADVETLAGFYLLWAALGVCMSALLYEPAFAVVTQVFGAHAKRGITALTLVAGFSSTVFVPLIEHLINSVGWRETFRILGVLIWMVSVPVHWLFVPRRVHDVPAAHMSADGGFDLRVLIRDPLFMSLTLWATAHAFVLVGLFFQLVPLWKSHGVDGGTIVAAIAVMGPMQVFGRVLIMVAGERVPLAVIGVSTSVVFPAVVLILTHAPMMLNWLVMALALLGLANGITTILRGAIPAEWFDRAHYAKNAGAIAVPVVVVGALAPWTLASIWQRYGETTMWNTVLAVTLVSTAAFVVAARLHRRQIRS